LCYRVYRNGEIIADDVQALSYTDDLRALPSAEYSYQVSANYNKGESNLTDPVTFNYLGVPGDGINEIPDEFFIDGNYPNPFNPHTSIRFGLPHASDVNLTVYNLLGRKVTELINEHRPAGVHIAVWNAENIPSGLYFYRIQAGEYKGMGKMLLVK
jgi:hypothetical protein